MELDIVEAQAYLQRARLDGWLLYDFKGVNPIAWEFAPFSGFVSRRWFLLIPQAGRPRALVHAIEAANFRADRVELRTYTDWRSLETELARLLKGCPTVAMEYSPRNAIPYVSRVDGGTLELVRAVGVEVRSSADLVQHFQARLGPEGLVSHRAAAAFLIGVVQEMFRFAADRIASGESVNEYDLQQEILLRFQAAGMIWEHPPIVAADARTALPHYEPSAERHGPIKEGALLLLDIFCRKDDGAAIHADITWTAWMGKRPVPEEIANVFSIVASARDRGVALIEERLGQGQPVRGFEVDDAVRAVIERAGYGPSFTHRTGHSLGRECHGNGVNLDNFESHDERILEPGLAFTIEPGIYLSGKFGIRSEINGYVGERGLEVTTLPLQREVEALL